MRLIILSCLYLFFLGSLAHAYIGPGLGLGAIFTAVTFVIVIIISIFAVLFYPIKRLLKNNSRKKNKKKN